MLSQLSTIYNIVLLHVIYAALHDYFKKNTIVCLALSSFPIRAWTLDQVSWDGWNLVATVSWVSAPVNLAISHL
jgi:hypothetical protein